ncbi:MAG TPA: ABC transporter, partial [Rhodocyclaceae bacterium]|nr:ABC transporter [Rhodocyclaceae bacterium]
MTVQSRNTLNGALAPLPDTWQKPVQERLAADETLLAWLETDLDARLRFAPGLLVLTDHRLLSVQPGSDAWNEFSLNAELTLHLTDHAGVGSLELVQGTGKDQRRLAHWRYTLGYNPSALRLLGQFER